MTHAIEESWHRRLAYFNYKALPYICKVVTGLPELKVDQERYMEWLCTREEHQEPVFEEGHQTEGVLALIHPDVCGPCHHPPLMGMYTMYRSLMIILIKDLDIF
jgi:hypothetical protein